MHAHDAGGVKCWASTPSDNSAWGIDGAAVLPRGLLRCRTTPIDVLGLGAVMPRSWAAISEERTENQEPRSEEHASTLSTYFKILTARAMTSATVITEMADCVSIVSFAHLVMGITSVGLKAVAFVNDTYR
jgi:hypothetical protein